jgi:transcriptional regulator with XRE-family HTH domain
MQIYMKPTQKERADLLRRIKAARHGLQLSYAVLAERADVDPSQVSRICRGEFATFSDSVVRICTVLGVQVGDAVSTPSGAIAGNGPKKTNMSWEKLERSVRRAWDKTPKGADRLAKVIAAVGEVAKI